MSTESGGPRRVQLRRTKGWRKPENTVVVARPSRWGNPFTVGSVTPGRRDRRGGPSTHTRASAVAAFRDRYAGDPQYRQAAVRELAGKNLACWCPLRDADGNRVPCHADVLLELANTAAGITEAVAKVARVEDGEPRTAYTEARRTDWHLETTRPCGA